MQFIPVHKDPVETVEANIEMSAYTRLLMERFKGRPSDLLEPMAATPGADTVEEHLFKVYNSIDDLPT
tara:strand:+ start:67 stop:270 length:204 start_codon:yes stop_codon:yes gene_type:complete